ncbi:MAG: IS66 family transposase, partial [Polyangiaceae bacterium]|nr:IS66 family transposase [Polyangiaceae bacterium]
MATKKHDCRWRGLAGRLEARLAERDTAVAERDAAVAERDAKLAALVARVNEIEHQLALARKEIFGRKSEKIPPVAEEAKKREGHKPVRGGHTNPRKRKENAEAMASLPTTVIEHPVPDNERRCPHCGDEIKPIGEGERSVEYEWVPGRFERRVHIVEVGRCPCKMHYARGPAPARVVEGCKYGVGFLAKLAVDKCGDATPIYRIEKAMRRAGIPLSRSTMNDLILLAGKLCMPLWKAALEEVRLDEHVQADETSFRTQGNPARSYVWTFLSKLHTVYVFAPSRSGETANMVLGGTTGRLTVDGHTGYNAVTEVEGRTRGGCWCHARRYLFEAL